MSKVGKWLLHKFDIAAKAFFYTVAGLVMITLTAGVIFWIIQAIGSLVW